MKIGIFGDSFADNVNGGSQSEKDLAWPSLLIKSGYDVDNFALTGTGPEWATHLLLEKFNRYNKVIFIFSNIERAFINPQWHEQLKAPHIDHHVRPHVDAPLNSGKFFHKVHKVAQEYHKYFFSFEEQRILMYNLMLNQLLGSNILILSMTHYIHMDTVANIAPYKVANELGLIDIFYHENKFLFPKGYVHNLDKRACHLTHWHHAMLHSKIEKWIQSGQFSLTKEDLIDIDAKKARKRYIGSW